MLDKYKRIIARYYQEGAFIDDQDAIDIFHQHGPTLLDGCLIVHYDGIGVIVEGICVPTEVNK